MRALRWARTSTAACVAVFAWTAGAAGQAPHTCPTFTSPPIPEAREGASYSVKLMSGPGAVQVTWTPPPALAFTNGVLAGVPAKPGTYSFAYKVTLDYACSGFSFEATNRWTRTENHTLKVRDVTAPQITSFTATPGELTASGGTLTVELKASDNFGVTKAMLTTLHPDGHQGSSIMRQAGGYNATNQKAAPATPAASTWTQTIDLPLNTAATAVTYTFTVAAYDPDVNAAKAGPLTVTVAGRATEGRPRLPPPKR